MAKNKQSSILVVEDEKSIREMISFCLKEHDFFIIEAEDAVVAQKLLAEGYPDLILLDWMLPVMSGLEFVRKIRNNQFMSDIPIIMLTARAEETQRVQGLDAGADDYIVKPFSPSELIARIKAVLRRGPVASKQGNLSFKELNIDLSSHRVTLRDESLVLGPTEYKLLKFFLAHQKRVYSREQIIYYIWGSNSDVEERTVDVHIRRLRKQLVKYKYDNYLQTIRSLGYMFLGSK